MRRGADAALVVAQAGDTGLGQKLGDLMSVGPLPDTSTTPGTFSSSLQIGSSKVPARVAPWLPAKRTARCLVPLA